MPGRWPGTSMNSPPRWSATTLSASGSSPPCPCPTWTGRSRSSRYCFDTLGADGVVLLANNRGVYLGDTAFDPVFDELQRRHTVVFVHPSPLPGLEPVPGIAPFVADFLLDTTRAALNLARSGTLERCPDLRILLAHAGGFLPFAAYRLASAASSTEDYFHGFGLLQRFYFDVALSSTPSAVPSLLAFAQPGQVTFGSDFPYTPTTRSPPWSGSTTRWTSRPRYGLRSTGVPRLHWFLVSSRRRAHIMTHAIKVVFCVRRRADRPIDAFR